MAFDYRARQARLLSFPGVDAVALVPGANLTYFTGLHVHLSERPTIALFHADGLSLIIPELEIPQIEARPDLDARLFAWDDAAGFTGAFDAAVAALSLDKGTLGVDGATMRVFEWLALREAGASRVADVGAGLRRLRSVKTPDEVAAIRSAIHLSETALTRLREEIAPGLTERQIATRLAHLLAESGSDGDAFGPLVQSGPNSALPHGGVTDRAWQRGEFLLIDYGGIKSGYPADITRTFCYGTPSGEMQRIYDTVLAANHAATAAIAPGVPAGEIDRAAREVIAQAGYGDRFIHRTGHGLGLEVHELPQIATGVETPLEAGMVFTVEPGIYVPGLGGVRIEDDVHVTAEGVEVLTAFPVDRLVLGG